MKKRKLLAAVVAVGLCLQGLSFPAMADSIHQDDSEWIVVNEDGVKHPGNEEAEGDGWYYDGNYTLTLDGYDGGGIRFHDGMYTPKDFTVELIGDNTITAATMIQGLYFTGMGGGGRSTLTFTGDGSLTFETVYSNARQPILVGSECSMTFEQSGVVTFNTGKMPDRGFTIQEGATVVANMRGSVGAPEMMITINGGRLQCNLLSQQFFWRGEKWNITEDGVLEVTSTYKKGAVWARPSSNLMTDYIVTDFDDNPASIIPDKYFPEQNSYVGLESEPDVGLSEVRIRGNGSYVYEPEEEPADPDPEKPTDPDPETPVNPDPEIPVNPDPETPVNPDPETPVNPDPETPADPDPDQPVTPEDPGKATDSNAAKPTVPATSSNASSSGGSSRKGSSRGAVEKTYYKAPAAGGTWMQDENGWWFAGSDGSYPKEGWAQLPWNGTLNWYFFNSSGYMHTGWLQEGVYWYYLHDVADGTLGYMYTGWHKIGGNWYYFNTEAPLPLGSMLKNTMTPDGYRVDSDGVWVEEN